MTDHDLFYKSIFLLFLGFLISILSILNKNLKFFSILTSFYVVFLFAGIIIVLMGSAMWIVWYIKNTKPFYDPYEKKQRLYASFLIVGIILVITGVIAIFYYRGITSMGYIISLIVSITGILLLINGLRLFIKQEIKKSV